MQSKRKIPRYKIGGLIGSLLVAAMGLGLLCSDGVVSQRLERFSYNLSFDLNRLNLPDVKDSGVMIVYIDEKSLKDLKQPQNAPMDRSLHAKLLNKLTAGGAKAVVMDIIFSDPAADPDTGIEQDQKFAEALRASGRVVLGVDYNRPEERSERKLEEGDTKKYEPINQVLTFPYQPFSDAMAHGGLVLLRPDSDYTVRKHLHQLVPEDLARVKREEQGLAPASLSWETARLTGTKLPVNPASDSTERWVNYYGPPGESIRGIGYSEAIEQDPAMFRDKIVFIGARPKTAAWGEKRDELCSPYSSWREKFTFMPMVEIHATQLLNLIRGDWLRRPSIHMESGILLLAAFILGYGLLYFRPWAATGVATLVVLAVVLVVQELFSVHHIWFPWLIIVLAQIPCALVYSIVVRSLQWYAQRRQYEEEQRQADARIREQAALLDKAGDAIIVHDLAWKAQFWNKSAEMLYGWTFEELQLLDLKADVFKTDENKLLAALQEALAKGEWSGELKQLTRTGKVLTIQSRWTLVRDEAGRPKSVLVINTDVTEQKKLELQFLRTQRMESIGTLAGGIAHDLNNVLSPILMGVEMMRMKNNDEFTNKMLSTMSASARRGSDMVKQVLTFARGQEGERSALQISHLVREMQKIVRETFPKSIEFNMSLGEGLWPILGDATQVHQIILNLCVNARDAMPNGGKITLSADNAAVSAEDAKKFPGAKAANYVLLAVTDNGTGIPPEFIEKIFEPFFTTKEIGKGTGLGLSTVISIIKSHGGFLDLQTEVGKGTSFNVYLPAAAVSVAAASAAILPETLRGNGETVMVVDDEPAVLEVTKQLLSHYGYSVVTAIHGADALALYPQYKDKLQLVIMDMMMPVMDGPMAISVLRKQDAGLPIIAISGLMAAEKIQEQLGVSVKFLPKPFAGEKLLLLIREVLSRPAQLAAVTGNRAQGQTSLITPSNFSREPSLGK